MGNSGWALWIVPGAGDRRCAGNLIHIDVSLRLQQ
jgi:hypothetical protein